MTTSSTCDSKVIDEAIRVNLVRHTIESLPSPKNVLDRYRVSSRQNGDLRGLFVAYMVVFVVATAVLICTWPTGTVGTGTPPSPGGSPILSVIFGSAIFGGLITIVAKLVEAGQRRLATADLFISEIVSIGRVLVAVQVIPNFSKLLRDTSMLKGFADKARSENYAGIFDKNTADLGTLTSRTIDNVTAFYSFLKGSRDATQSLNLWSQANYPDEQKKEDVIAIVFCCFFMAIHGRLALEALIEKADEARLTLAREIFHTLELQAFLLLVATLATDDPRVNSVRLRSKYYRDLLTESSLPEVSQLVANRMPG